MTFDPPCRVFSVRNYYVNVYDDNIERPEDEFGWDGTRDGPRNGLANPWGAGRCIPGQSYFLALH
jgi:hypothetical protein